MGLIKFLTGVGNAAHHAQESFKFREFLKKERASQVAELDQELATVSAAGFRDYENRFLLYAIAVPDLHLRVRAFELYAYVKFAASARLAGGKWVGFLPETADAHRGELPWT